MRNYNIVVKMIEEMYIKQINRGSTYGEENQ